MTHPKPTPKTSATNATTRLRGSLPAVGLNARGIERVARNPDCERLVALTLASVSPSVALQALFGETAQDARSPVAMAAGHRFESLLFEHAAAALVSLYTAAQRLPQDVSVLDLSALGSTRSPEGRARIREGTRDVLSRALAGEAVPRVLLKPRLMLEVGATEHEVEPDALVWSVGEPFYRVVEVKAYPDRGGKTAPDDLRGACRQAAVGVVALRQLLSALGDKNSCGRVPSRCDLVLQRPGRAEGSLHPMTLAGEVSSLDRLLPSLPARLAALSGRLSDRSLDDREAFLTLEKHWRPDCRSECALAAKCRSEMRACGDPALLGTAARETLRPVGSVVIALDLVRGRRAPANDDERRLVERLQSAESLVRKVANHGR